MPVIVEEANLYPVDNDLLFVMDDWRLNRYGQIDESSFGAIHGVCTLSLMGCPYHSFLNSTMSAPSLHSMCGIRPVDPSQCLAQPSTISPFRATLKQSRQSLDQYAATVDNLVFSALIARQSASLHAAMEIRYVHRNSIVHARCLGR